MYMSAEQAGGCQDVQQRSGSGRPLPRLKGISKAAARQGKSEIGLASLGQSYERAAHGYLQGQMRWWGQC